MGVAAGNLHSLLGQVKAALIGYQVGSGWWPVQYSDGRPLESGGGLEIWTETFEDSHYLQEA